MTKIWAIGRTTFLQCVRQPVFAVLIFVTFAILLASLPLSGWTVSTDYHDTDQKFMISNGLGALLVTGLLLAAFCATSAITREIESRTALTVVSKPVPRASFVLGKFFGVSAAVMLAYYVCALAFILIVRHHVRPAVSDPYDWPVIILGSGSIFLALGIAVAGNILFNWTFTSTCVWAVTALLSVTVGIITFVGKQWEITEFGNVISSQLILAIVLLMMAVIVFSAIAVAASTRFGQVLTLGVCLGAFFVGSIHQAIFTGEAQNIVAVKVLAAIIPDLSSFYPLDALMQDKHIPMNYFALAAAYCVLYSSAALLMGMALFQTRSMEGQGGSTSMPKLAALVAWLGLGEAIAMAIIACIIFSVPENYTTRRLLIAGSLLAVAAVSWVFWMLFGRGVKWTYFVALLATLLNLARCIAMITLGGNVRWARIPGEADAHIVLQTVIGSVILLILILPKTRRHFASESL